MNYGAAVTEMTRRTRWAIAAAIAAFAAFWFGLMGGFNVLDPRSTDWMLAGDWHGHYFCSLFTRNGPWGFPLGQAPDLMYPHGSSAAFGDCLPFMSVAVKMLGPLFPFGGQGFGVWMLLVLILLGLTGARLLAVWEKDPFVLAVAGMLFITNPIITSRSGHPQFFTQFPIVALVGLGLIPVRSLLAGRRVAIAALALGAFTCSINGYLAAMAMVLTFAVMLRLLLTRCGMSRREQLLWLLAAPVATLSTFALFGYFVGFNRPLAELTAEGFGQFSADLGTFWNPMGAANARLWPTFPANGRQWEGFAYLGLGVLVLLALRLVLAIRHRRELPERSRLLEFLPITVAALGCMAYATSSHVTFHGKLLFNLSEFYSHFGSLTSVFRGSGRFAWPLHALLTWVALGTLFAFRGNVFWQRHLIAGALLLQVADLNLSRDRFHGPFPRFEPLANPVWNASREGYDHIVVHPIMAQWACPYDEGVVIKLSWEAYRNHLTINSGLVGRNPPEVKAACMKHLLPAQLDPRSIYVVYFPEYLPDLLGQGYACGLIDKLNVCVSESFDTPFLREVRLHPIGTR